jgi:hypothetical protein
MDKRINNSEARSFTKSWISILLISLNVFAASGHDGQVMIKRDRAVEKRECLELCSSAMDGGCIMKGLTIRLYRGENLIAEIPETSKEKVFMTLEKNSQYTISYSAKGYVTRLISIDTHLTERVSVNPLFRFVFDVEMMAECKVSNNYYSDFPVGLICYNKESQKFEFSKIYTREIKIGLAETSFQCSPEYSGK